MSAAMGAGARFFGGLRTENGQFNMKANLTLPLVETLRVLAISRGIAEQGAARHGRRRWRRVTTYRPKSAALARMWRWSHRLVLRQQIADIAAGQPPSSHVATSHLNSAETGILKAISGRVTRLDTLLTRHAVRVINKVPAPPPARG